jgi:hypothetical protein
VRLTGGPVTHLLLAVVEQHPGTVAVMVLVPGMVLVNVKSACPLPFVGALPSGGIGVPGPVTEKLTTTPGSGFPN